jgi:very-short-patch-repair endonuclease
MQLRWQRPEYAEKTIHSMNMAFERRWADPEFRSQTIDNLIGSGPVSLLEKRVASVAIKYGYVSSYNIGRYIVDLANIDEKIIVEVNGDLWHCNPKIYNKDFVIPVSGKSAESIWEKDLNRRNFLENLGYRFYVLWETDILKGEEKYLLEFFNNVTKNKNQPRL